MYVFLILILQFLACSIAVANVKIGRGDVVTVYKLKQSTQEGYNLLVRSVAYADQGSRAFFYLAKQSGNTISGARSEGIDSQVDNVGFNPDLKPFVQYRVTPTGPQDPMGAPIRPGQHTDIKNDNVVLELIAVDGEAPLLRGRFHGQTINTEMQQLPRLIPLLPSIEAYELVNERKAIEVNGEQADVIIISHFGYETATTVVFDNGSRQGGQVLGHRVNVIFGKKTARGVLPLLIHEGRRNGWDSEIQILDRELLNRKAVLSIDPKKMVVQLGDGARSFLKLQKPDTVGSVPAESIYGYRYEQASILGFRYSPTKFAVSFTNREQVCEKDLLAKAN